MTTKRLILPILLFGIASTGCDNAVSDEPQNFNKENYVKVFVKEFGIIDPHHNWGFEKRKPASRAVTVETYGVLDGSKMNTQGNLWKNPPMVKDWEEAAVMEYLRSDRPKKTVETINLTNSYFITHVGSTDKERPDLSGGTKSGVVLDQLKVGFASKSLDDIDNYEKWDHARDFNASSNKDNLGNTVCVDGGSMNFAYHSGLDNCWYDRYIIVPGSEIDYRLSYYYYICFDFEAYKAANVKTNYYVYYKLNGETNVRERNSVGVPGIYEHEWGDPGKAPVSKVTEALREALGDQTSTISVTNYVLESQPYTDGDKYLKADGIYDDWVIRICGNAILECQDIIPEYPHEDPNTYRVFVEDLSIAAAYDINNVSKSDWDFNDLVFDLKFDGNKTKVVLRALGGTMPIFIGDGKGNLTQELHKYFGVGQGQMVNTGQGPVKAPVDITEDLKTFQFEIGDPNSVRVYVKYNGSMAELSELTANPGEAPSKLCVPSYLACPAERMIITIPYPNFRNYVADRDQKFWEHKENINNRNK